MATGTRSESDYLGTVEIPFDRAYGCQTARALKNFPVSEDHYVIGRDRTLIQAIVNLKAAAAIANFEIGALDSNRRDLILSACAELASTNDYTFDFPIHILHGGGGTSANMNVNEVVANLANRIANSCFGNYDVVHPLDHVNKNQSTNDVYPSACRLSIATEGTQLVASLKTYQHTWVQLSNQYGKIPRLMRTCLRDAKGSDYGVYFDAQTAIVKRLCSRLVQAINSIGALNVGGGVGGERRATSRAYRLAIYREITVRYPALSIRQVKNFASAAQYADDLLDFSQVIDCIARVLVKQCFDLRILGSGPNAGIAEIVVPPTQLGSSAMPGKINPVIPEFVVQACFVAIGHCASCSLAAMGELDLNVWEGVFAYGLKNAIRLVVSALARLVDGCLVDLGIDRERSSRNASVPIAKVAAEVSTSSYTSAFDTYVRLLEANLRIVP